MRTEWRKYLSRRMMLPALVVLLAVLSVGFAMQPRNITVVADGKYYKAQTVSRSVSGMVADANVHLGEHDRVQVSEEKNGQWLIRIHRAVPIEIDVDGKAVQTYTTYEHVAEAVAQAGYDGRRYVVLMPADSKVVPQMKIPVATYQMEKVTQEEKVPFDVMVQPDPTMRLGEEKVVSQGVDGLRQATYERILVDGREVGRHEVASQVLKKPVAEKLARGTRSVVETSRGALRFTKVIEMEATAYHPMDGDGNGITASGIPAKRGVVAVDPNVIPLGSRVYIPGYGEAIAADTGGAIQGARIDLCMESYPECYAYGRRQVEVYILAQ